MDFGKLFVKAIHLFGILFINLRNQITLKFRIVSEENYLKVRLGESVDFQLVLLPTQPMFRAADLML